MRVPLLLSIPLAVLTVAGMWWWNTRNMDFLTPPGERELAAIRASGEPVIDGNPAGVEENVDPGEPAEDSGTPEEPQTPPIELGDTESAPGLSAYVDIAPKGTVYLIALADRLEEIGKFQRSLLARERILDSSNPDPLQAAAAIDAIKRVRPTLTDWNIDPSSTIAIILSARTSPDVAKPLKPILEKVASDLEIASSGILKITPQLTTGKPAAANAPSPIAISFSGLEKNSNSTETLSFTVSDNANLADSLQRNIYRLVSHQIQKSTDLSPLLPLSESADPTQALHLQITRLAWKKIGEALNAPAR